MFYRSFLPQEAAGFAMQGVAHWLAGTICEARHATQPLSEMPRPGMRLGLGMLVGSVRREMRTFDAEQ